MGLDYWKVLGIHESGWRVHLSFGARGLDGEGELLSQPPAARDVPLSCDRAGLSGFGQGGGARFSCNWLAGTSVSGGPRLRWGGGMLLNPPAARDIPLTIDGTVLLGFDRRGGSRLLELDSGVEG